MSSSECKSGYWTIDKLKLYYEHFSHPTSDITVVLLHGFLSSSFSFRRLIPLLSEKVNVISIDIPPFGKSGNNQTYIYSHQNHANSVIKLIKHLGIDQAILIGHSMGGQIVLNICYYYPKVVTHAVLLCSSGYLKRSNPPLILSSYLPFFYLYVRRWLARSGVVKNLRNVVHDHSMIDDAMVEGYLRPFTEDNGIFKGLTKMIRDREGDLTSEQLQKIDTPCLLIWGEYDKVVPVQTGKQLNKDLKNSTFILLKNTGHLVPEERPDEVFQHIINFTLTL